MVTKSFYSHLVRFLMLGCLLAAASLVRADLCELDAIPQPDRPVSANFADRQDYLTSAREYATTMQERRIHQQRCPQVYARAEQQTPTQADRERYQAERQAQLARQREQARQQQEQARLAQQKQQAEQEKAQSRQPEQKTPQQPVAQANEKEQQAERKAQLARQQEQPQQEQARLTREKQQQAKREQVRMAQEKQQQARSPSDERLSSTAARFEKSDEKERRPPVAEHDPCGAAPMDEPRRPEKSNYRDDPRGFLADALKYQENRERFANHQRRCPHLYFEIASEPEPELIDEAVKDEEGRERIPDAFPEETDQRIAMPALGNEDLAESALEAGGLIGQIDRELLEQLTQFGPDPEMTEQMVEEALSDGLLAEALLANMFPEFRGDLADLPMEVVRELFMSVGLDNLIMVLSHGFVVEEVTIDKGVRIEIGTEDQQRITGQIIGQTCLSSGCQGLP